MFGHLEARRVEEPGGGGEVEHDRRAEGADIDANQGGLLELVASTIAESALDCSTL
jgi:hypothetical protein